MKKTLFILALLTIPFSAAQAERKATSPNHFTPELIKITADRFAHVFCSNDPEKIADAVKDCYLNTPPEDQKRLQCYLADNIFSNLALQGRTKAKQLGIDSANPYADIPFSTSRAYGQRMKAIKATPGFEFINNEFDNDILATNKVQDLMNKSSYCQKKAK